jgi:aspartokinase
LLGDYSQKIKDEVLAQGEILSAKLVASLLAQEEISAKIYEVEKVEESHNLEAGSIITSKVF